MSTDLTPTHETWTYAGERHDAKGKIAHAWVDEAGKSLWYSTKNAKGRAVGGIYTIDVIRKPDGTVSAYFGTLAYQRASDDTDQVVIWEGLHRETRDDEARAAAERKHERNPEIATAMAELERIIGKCRTRQEAVAVRSLVMARLDAAWWNR